MTVVMVCAHLHITIKLPVGDLSSLWPRVGEIPAEMERKQAWKITTVIAAHWVFQFGSGNNATRSFSPLLWSKIGWFMWGSSRGWLSLTNIFSSHRVGNTPRFTNRTREVPRNKCDSCNGKRVDGPIAWPRSQTNGEEIIIPSWDIWRYNSISGTLIMMISFPLP